jgi:hypothetical protein
VPNCQYSPVKIAEKMTNRDKIATEFLSLYYESIYIKETYIKNLMISDDGKYFKLLYKVYCFVWNIAESEIGL